MSTSIDFELAAAAAAASTSDGSSGAAGGGASSAAATTTFGQDVFCIDEIRSGRLARGLMLVAQRAYHRLITPRGTLSGSQDDEEFGTDIIATIGATDDASVNLPGMIRSELTKDPCIETATAVVTRLVESNGDVSYTLDILCTTALGPFELVMAVSEEVVTRARITFPEA